MSWIDRLIPADKKAALALKVIEMKYGAMRVEAKVNALMRQAGLEDMRKALDAEFDKRMKKAQEEGESIL